MSSTVVKRAVLLAWLTLASSVTLAKGLDVRPRILQVPVLGLRYEIAMTKFDALPADVNALCATNPKNIQGRYFIFASARDSARSYYVIGGYEVRTHPEPPDYPRYEPYDSGGVIFLEGNRCEDLGDAQEVFEDGASASDLSQSIIQQLAKDFAARLIRGFGGKNRLQAEMRNQHLDLDRLTPELREALRPYLRR